MTDTGALRFSVVVASNGRPEWLARCLKGLRHLDYPVFEVVVVADTPSLMALADDPVLALCKTVTFDAEHLAEARNAGIAVAAGEVVAFIDDDAVPEPNWLIHHARALETTGAGASVGFVRGRNGLTFQSQAASVDAEAETHAEPAPEAATCPAVLPGRAIKLVGTNAAIRRDCLLAVGGYDPAFRFYLEDSDISLRLASIGVGLAVAPLAEVHHAFAASGRRTSRRMPRRLFEIGRSTALFLRRHPGLVAAEMKDRMDRRERRRLLRHMVRGTCEPRDVARLLSDLDAGWSAGLAESLPDIALESAATDFLAMPRISAGHTVLSSRLFGRRAMKKKAAQLVAEGHRVSVFSFSLTLIRHHVVFTPTGYWLQTGGQFGRSMRDQPLVRWYTFAGRLRQEIARIAKQRGITDTEKTVVGAQTPDALRR